MDTKRNPADAVERWPIEKLVPYAKNSRTHSEEQIAQIAASIREFGFTTAVLVDESGGIIAGHGRVMAARKLGISTIPVMLAAGWTDAQRRAYVIADNKLALNAGWDDEMLSLELGELGDIGFDLKLIGFTGDEIKELSQNELNEGLTDADEVPEPPADPITKPGDLWILGEHRLLCGDSTKAPIDTMFDAVVTDPPYIIGAVSVGNARTKSGSWHDMMNSAQWFSSWYSAWWSKLKPEGFLASFGNWRTLPVMVKAAADVAIPIQSCLVWDKDWIGPANEKMLRVQYEICTIAARENAAIRDRSRGDVVRIKWHGAFSNTTGHAAEKPVELLSWLIETLTVSGGVVADPFCGSGTTLIAAEQLGRICYGMEISPAYCDVIVKRWEDFTGKKATHAENGKHFDEIKNASE